jgi:hypothetical protein
MAASDKIVVGKLFGLAKSSCDTDQILMAQLGEVLKVDLCQLFVRDFLQKRF